MIVSLTYKSILNRKTAFFLSVISIAISVVLLLGIERIVKGSKEHFMNTINKTDLIVAAPDGEIDILLNLVFHIGDGLTEIPYSAYEKLAKEDSIDWAVPIGLGDSFHQFDVVATNSDYFKYYKFGQNRPLRFAAGQNFQKFYDVIIGSDIAKKMGLHVGDMIHLSHSGAGSHEHHEHANREFRICGILAKSATPNDDVVFMQLKTDEAIHLEWQSGRFVDMHISSEKLAKMDIKPKHISGILLGLEQRSQILAVQDQIDKEKSEKLKAVIPAKTLTKLYRIIAKVQDILVLISVFVFIAALFTMLSSMYATLNERRREISILRSLGATVKIIFSLFIMESFLIVMSALVLGNIVLTVLIYLSPLGIELSYLPDMKEFGLLGLMLLAALITSIIPAIKSYRNSLQDGLSIKL